MLCEMHFHFLFAGVPSHNSRDYEFANKYNISLATEVVSGDTIINSYQVSYSLNLFKPVFKYV